MSYYIGKLICTFFKQYHPGPENASLPTDSVIRLDLALTSRHEW